MTELKLYRTLVFWIDAYLFHHWLDRYDWLDPLWGSWRVELCDYVERLYGAPEDDVAHS